MPGVMKQHAGVLQVERLRWEVGQALVTLQSATEDPDAVGGAVIQGLEDIHRRLDQLRITAPLSAMALQAADLQHAHLFNATPPVSFANGAAALDDEAFEDACELLEDVSDPPLFLQLPDDVLERVLSVDTRQRARLACVCTKLHSLVQNTTKEIVLEGPNLVQQVAWMNAQSPAVKAATTKVHLRIPCLPPYGLQPQLWDFHNLQDLVIDNIAVKDSLLTRPDGSLLFSTTLRSLRITEYQIGPTGLAESLFDCLYELPELRSLYLGGLSGVTVIIPYDLTRLRHLEVLTIAQEATPDNLILMEDGLGTTTWPMPALQELTLQTYSLGIPDEAHYLLGMISSAPQLTCLRIMVLEQVEPEEHEPFMWTSVHNTGLQELQLCASRGISMFPAADAVADIALMRGLRRLRLSCFESAVHHGFDLLWSSLALMPVLEELVLGSWEAVTMNFAALRDFYPSLKWLGLEVEFLTLNQLDAFGEQIARLDGMLLLCNGITSDDDANVTADNQGEHAMRILRDLGTFVDCCPMKCFSLVWRRGEGRPNLLGADGDCHMKAAWEQVDFGLSSALLVD